MKQRVVILGGSGMLGQELVSLFSHDGISEVIAWSHDDMDVTDLKALRDALHTIKPQYIINSTAYNAVDICETDDEEYEKALLLNRDVPGALALISKEIGSTFVHYSTDYVFGDYKQQEYGISEDSIPSPTCRYGVSKYEGEKAVQLNTQKYYIIRLSRLFGKKGQGSGKKSFFETMLSLSESKKELQAVGDEVSCFTYAPDLALATQSLMSDMVPYGIYHLVNEGAVSWHEGLSLAYALLNKGVVLHKVNGDDFKRQAKRPAFSVLLNTKRPKLRHYKEALFHFVGQS